MKYLITDPCYTIPEQEDWMKFLEETDYCNHLPAPIQIPNVGTLIKLSPTTNGDGSAFIGSQVIGVDSGTVCVIEVADDFQTLPATSFGAIVPTLEEAENAFKAAKAI